MKDFFITVIGIIFLSMWIQYSFFPEIGKSINIAITSCGGEEKVQWLEFGGMWGGFGWGCMPK